MGHVRRAIFGHGRTCTGAKKLLRSIITTQESATRMTPNFPDPRAPTEAKTRQIVFVLMNEFTLLSFSGALDSLRIANRQAGYEAYRWRVVSESGAPVRSSAGIEIAVDGAFEPLRHDDTIVLCGGMNAAQNTSDGLLAYLRREARRGATLIAVCTAPYALAKAGLLNGKRNGSGDGLGFNGLFFINASHILLGGGVADGVGQFGIYRAR